MILNFEMPEERNDFLLASHGQDFYLVLWNFDNFNLRNRIKHGNFSDETREELEKLRQELNELMNDYGVSLDMVS